MTIEFITKRIEGKEKEIAKLEKKLERILKAQESNWENNPYYYDESDLKWTTKDLENARKGLEDYKAKLAEATEKANSRDIKAIIDFLEDWKKRVTDYYVNVFPEYVEALNENYRIESEYCKWFNHEGFKAPKEVREQKRKERREHEQKFHTAWGFMARYDMRLKTGVRELDKELLKKDLDAEADRKYDDIIERTNKEIGTITDAAGLSVGNKGDLNGFIIGERGTVKVNTIGAGGYNIQCFHFRTLIHKVK